MYDRAYDEGISFRGFLQHVKANRDLWHAMANRARVAEEMVRRARRLPGEWRLLAIAEDWCGDAVNILPVVARLAEHVDSLELRIVSRDSSPGLMDRHRTEGTLSIPVLIVLDLDGACRGWWGPRPAELQAWFEVEGRPLPKSDRYRELRRWYARDRGATIAGEVVDLLACAALADPRGCGDAARPCPERQAA
jgi:hypothetical protein